jgi:hypothetical protein
MIMSLPTHCFVSYSHVDHEGFGELCAHLSPVALAFQNMTLLHDRRLRAGDYWNDRIQADIARSQVYILLVSADFFNSGYIIQHEWPAMLERHKAHGALLLPVIYRPCFWSVFFGSHIQVVPVTREGQLQAVRDWPRVDNAFAAAADAIACAIADHFDVRPTGPFGAAR